MDYKAVITVWLAMLAISFVISFVFFAIESRDNQKKARIMGALRDRDARDAREARRR